MAERWFGIDFGTTNSLAAVVVDGHAQALVGPDNRPHPSVLWYRGAGVVVGRPALDFRDAGSGGTPPGFLRSPKMTLRRGGPIHLEGRVIDPTAAVAEILKFLKRDAAAGGRGESFDITNAVMTVPVDFAGQQRRALRAAARKADMGVIQFVHEPVAALYAWVRGQSDWRKELERLAGRIALVFDWGGGTLDLTLCRIRGDTIAQIASTGTDDVGGDLFDERLRNLVRERHGQLHHRDDVLVLEAPGMASQLLAQCELRKIELSAENATSRTILIRDYLRVDGPAKHLNATITRDDLSSVTGGLVQCGIAWIDKLLEDNHLDYRDVELCLATGGMVNMPAIRNALVERFAGRVPKLGNGDRIIAEGAALIAYDNLRLHLVKPIEVLVADESGRGSYHALVPAGLSLPVENQVNTFPSSRFYCVDPTDGTATFELAKPKRIGEVDPTGARTALCSLSLPVDSAAEPLLERLSCDLQIDHDYIAHVVLKSSGCDATASAEIHNLDFGLTLPGHEDTPPTGSEDDSDGFSGGSGGEDRRPAVVRHGSKRVTQRSNVHHAADDRETRLLWRLVPGDILETWRPNAFGFSGKFLTARQRKERDYYRECSYCRRTSFAINAQGPLEECIAHGCKIASR